MPPGRWSQAAMEAMDADAIRASLPHEPTAAALATARIAQACTRDLGRFA
ncbi:hypothetical protein [Streptomyces acidicola]